MSFVALPLRVWREVEEEAGEDSREEDILAGGGQNVWDFWSFLGGVRGFELSERCLREVVVVVVVVVMGGRGRGGLDSRRGRRDFSSSFARRSRVEPS